jgi:D-glycero-D-manno-heptose 1,7-bisphosphate phosphatase
VKAIFLDRDGVINRDDDYVHKKEDFYFMDGVFETLLIFSKLGFTLFIITNQSGIARGYYTKNDFEILTDWMLKKLADKDIKISKVLHCPHLPTDDCLCRKPKTGMIDDILKEYNIDLEKSFLIGDKNSDIECGLNARIQNTILITKDTNIKTDAKYIIDDIKQSAEIIRRDYES